MIINSINSTLEIVELKNNDLRNGIKINSDPPEFSNINSLNEFKKELNKVKLILSKSLDQKWLPIPGYVQKYFRVFVPKRNNEIGRNQLKISYLPDRNIKKKSNYEITIEICVNNQLHQRIVQENTLSSFLVDFLQVYDIRQIIPFLTINLIVVCKKRIANDKIFNEIYYLNEISSTGQLIKVFNNPEKSRSFRIKFEIFSGSQINLEEKEISAIFIEKQYIPFEYEKIINSIQANLGGEFFNLTGKMLPNISSSSPTSENQIITQNNDFQNKLFSYNSSKDNSQNRNDLINNIKIEYDHPNYWISLDYLRYKIEEITQLNLNYLNTYQTLNSDYSTLLVIAENKTKELDTFLTINPKLYNQQLHLQIQKDIALVKSLPLNDPNKYLVEKRINIFNNELRTKFKL